MHMILSLSLTHSTESVGLINENIATSKIVSTMQIWNCDGSQSINGKINANFAEATTMVNTF